MSSFFHSFNKYILSNFYMPDSLLNSGKADE